MTRNRILTIIVVLAVMAGLLLDLANQGLAWRVFWNLTGEEAPASQLVGMVDWAGNFIRAQPVTKPLVPIDHTYENPYGINVFLQDEVEPEKRERIVQMVSEAGFQWIRQQFPWEDIEIHGRGDFEDRRNDMDGDGEVDAISAWAKYDQIVDLAEQYGVDIFARLDNPPAWSRSNPDSGDFAPPDDVGDFVNYASAVAERYRGRLRYYQVWNEPNIYPEWGEQDVNPEAYTDLLCRTYDALKAVDPDIVVISGALAPTISLTGRDLSDLIFLQRMYDAGAADCFDILAVQGYGFNSGPTDRRLRVTNVNFGHNVYIRDLMVANSDEHTPIWITEAAWNPQPRDPSIVTTLYGNYGIVTEEQAARYMPLAYERAQQEWPWVGAMFYWFFKRPHDFEANQSWYYFRMVEPDFTPLPVYESMKAYITGSWNIPNMNHTSIRKLYSGVHQENHWAFASPMTTVIDMDAAQFGQVAEVSRINFIAQGTDLLIRWYGEGNLYGGEASWPDWFAVEGGTLEFSNTASLEGWHLTHIRLPDNIFPIPRSLSIWAYTNETYKYSPSQEWRFDSITVIDRTYENLFGPVAAVFIGAGMLVWVVLRALRERRRAKSVVE